MGTKINIKLEHGSIYQKQANGTFFYRYQVNGKRKAVSLKTNDQKKAKEAAEAYIPIIQAPSVEVVAAHVAYANFGITKKELRLSEAWGIYEEHPDRATPATVSEQQAYKLTWRDFVDYVKEDLFLNEVEPELAGRYADHMRKMDIAVDTHNRKIRRLKKVFETLKDYHNGISPFAGKALRRKGREDHEHTVRRRSFTKEQEQELLKVLDDEKYRVMNKQEIRILYYIGMFTGQRLKDCALLKWGRISLKTRRIWVKQFKTGKEVTIPIASKLLEVLNKARNWQRDDYVLPSLAERYQQVDGNGKNVGANLVSIDTLRVIKWIGLEPSVKVPGRHKKVTVYGFHSLRHSFASHCAEAGVPKAVVVSIMGAASDIIDKHYVHVGEEAQLKAIEAIDFGEGAHQSAQEKVDEALSYISNLPEKCKSIQAVEDILK